MSWAAESAYEQWVGKDIALQKPIIITLDNDSTPIQIEVSGVGSVREAVVKHIEYLTILISATILPQYFG